MNISNLKKIFPTYILLIFIPSLFGLLLYSFILNIDHNHELNKIKSELSERVTDFMVTTTPIDYFQPLFKNLSDKLFSFIKDPITSKDASFTKKNISKTIRDFEKKLGDLKLRFVCAVFDENGILINSNDLKDYETRFFTYVWRDIHKIPKADYPNRGLDQYLIVGNEFTTNQLVGKKEHCISTFLQGKSGVFYINNLYKPKDSDDDEVDNEIDYDYNKEDGVIIFKDENNKNNEKDNSQNHLIKKDKENFSGTLIFIEHKRKMIELIQAKIRDFATFELPIILYDSENKKRKTITYGHKEIAYDRTETEEFLNGFVENDVLWIGFKSDEYKLLFGKLIKNPNYYKYKFLIILFLFIIGLTIITYLFFKNLTNNEGIFISIRYKLIFIFALAIYMPTLSLWVLSYTSLHDHRTAIENKVKKGMLDILNKIDTDYKKTEDIVRNRFLELDQYLNSFRGKQPPKKDEITAELRRIVGKNNKTKHTFNWLDIRSIDQTQIYTSYNDEINQRLEKLGKIFSILCLERYCPNRLTHAGIKPSQADMIIGNFFENPILGFASIFERPKQLNYLTFEGLGVYWWWNYIPDFDNPISFYIGTTPSKYTTLSYFSTLLKERYTLENTNLKVINFSSCYQEFIPKIDSNRKELIDLINVSNLNKTVESTIINYKNGKYLCLCMPGSNLKDCFSICMYPIIEIDYQIEKLRSSIYTLIILLLIISVFTGLLLAKTFITPIKELNRGLEALRKRETETVIKIENKDELGHLGEAFNQMMAEIKDMLLAGAVQQCLIPTGKYKIEGYDCVVYNQMATNVGGDYADIFELPDDKLLIVVGDVTGHGVASSLLTAMVKASIYRFANKNTSLNEIVTNTSNMICDLLNKRKLMTFCAITLDKNTGELAICNAGHPYPYIREKEAGIIRTPCKTSLPMGLTKKRCRYTSEAEILKPEETLFIYTDGFPEAENDKGEEFGYDKFKEIISNAEITSSEALRNQLLDIFKSYHGDAELADDITFIILRRKPLQDN